MISFSTWFSSFSGFFFVVVGSPIEDSTQGLGDFFVFSSKLLEAIIEGSSEFRKKIRLHFS